MGERIFRAIGVMSGTSMDAIDVALVETDGERILATRPGLAVAYPPALRRDLAELVADRTRAASDPAEALEAAVTDAHAGAVEAYLAREGLRPADVDLVGLHGQTIYHDVAIRLTRQLGLGAAVARRLGIDTVYRFRQADVAAGGEGAPFAPLYHRALAKDLPKPLMVLNLGGVANVTWLGGGDDGAVIAFDTGPASALIDDFVASRTGQSFDRGGRLAASGTVDRAMLARFLAHGYFAKVPPKSLDRNEFHRLTREIEALSDADGAATLMAFTVESVAAAGRHVPEPPRRWLVTGGGRHNGAMMAGLRARLRVAVDPVEVAGWDGDFLEAQCFGYLAVRSVLGLPLSLPGTTGVPLPLTGGELARAR
ncbi:MAG: anhydro-N-acetylmuramic acid kinase [Ancalomicrobiaceae bacterium]|nr:anhydro-N-acetylmuramic acid kinase [Ancalomicrobiaceae bacterium]